MWDSEIQRLGYKACIKQDAPNTGMFSVFLLVSYSALVVLSLMVWYGVGDLSPWILVLPNLAIIVLHKWARNARAAVNRKRFLYQHKAGVSSWFEDGKLQTYPPGSAVTRPNEDGEMTSYLASGEVSEVA